MRKPLPPPHPSKALGYEYRDVIVTDTATGEFHHVAPYVKTDSEAMELARMTWKDTDKWKLQMRRDVATRSLVCSICGAERVIAYGNIAMTITMPLVYASARRIGWTMNPKVICQGCQP